MVQFAQLRRKQFQLISSAYLCYLRHDYCDVNDYFDHLITTTQNVISQQTVQSKRQYSNVMTEWRQTAPCSVHLRMFTFPNAQYCTCKTPLQNMQLG